jgi:UDP-N-acetylmuramoyl-L-alanyl-D-glutamate--2,6-diaminopimelate ligase
MMTSMLDLKQPESGTSLSELAALLSEHSPRLVGPGATRVLGVRQDSRRVEPGELFVARRGQATRGAEFARQAQARGAAALLLERGESLPDVDLPRLEVADLKLALARAAEAVYGYPSRELDVIGITGTNGKTTVSFLIEQGLAATGARPARLGTLGLAFMGEALPSGLTTPEADDIARSAREIVRRGGTQLVMEVSSIALVQERVSALRFRVAALTNLTQDHLDFHGTFRAYAEAKAQLFTRLSPALSVLHVGDAFGRELAARVSGTRLTVAVDPPADIYVREHTASARGIRARVVTPRGECELNSALVGAHNLENLLVSLGVLIGLGHAPELAAGGLAAAPPVPGRLERCDEAGDDVLVLVDYAHTPDALTRVLAAVRGLGSGRLYCVFGCGGDRDPSKRPLMGEAVARGADVAIVTSDNPRSEDPAAIVQAILPGLARGPAESVIELHRARAIEDAVLSAAPGDVVLIAGKGHENHQIVGAERHAFDDRQEARRALSLRRGRAHGG